MEKKDINEMTAPEMVAAMNKDDYWKLYWALLHIDEVNLIGNDLLHQLWELVKSQTKVPR